MNAWNVTVAPEFGDDLRGIHSYIANVLLEPMTAKSVADRILKAVQELNHFPLRHPLYEKEPWHSRNLRKMPIGNYLVFYLANEKNFSVLVLRVFYAGRDIQKRLEKFL